MLIGTGKTGRIYVSSASEPLLLRISHRTKAGGILTFSSYGARVTLRRPPASRTIEGRRFGL